MFRHCGIELEGMPLVSVPLCDETCMHAPMHRCTVLPFGVANGPSYFQEFMLNRLNSGTYAFTAIRGVQFFAVQVSEPNPSP